MSERQPHQREWACNRGHPPQPRSRPLAPDRLIGLRGSERPSRRPSFAVSAAVLSQRMPRISTFYGIVVWMYHDDHAPPHVHVNASGRFSDISPGWQR